MKSPLKVVSVLFFLSISASLTAFQTAEVSNFMNCSEDSCTKEINKMEQLARRGSPEANYIMATLYLYGEIVEKNERKAESLFKRAAVDGGMAEAYYMLAQMYKHGWGVNKDSEMVERYTQKALNGGSTSAKFDAAVKYLQDKDLSTEDLNTAVEYLSQLSKKRNNGASYLLGEIYLEGYKHIEADPDKGLDLMKKAARQGNLSARGKLREMASLAKTEEERNRIAPPDDPSIEVIQVTAVPQNMAEYLDFYVDSIESQKIYDGRSVFRTGRACTGNNGCQVSGGDTFFLSNGGSEGGSSGGN